ncbi:MAG TPA: hypothetical protein VHE78_08210 [Gemmatimonadaceae bacterium]|nr:hypothetical protein [Gemmatimonadaceae bacterium]
MRIAPFVALSIIGASSSAAQQEYHGAAPAISPDGRYVAFQSDRGGSDHVYLITIDGTGERVLPGSANADRPAWSKDGSRILYSVFVGDSGTLYSSSIDGSDRRPLVTVPGRNPIWIEEGRSLAYGIGDWSKTVIAVADAHGQVVRQIADSTGSAWNVVPSPDGKRLAYTRAARGQNLQVCVVDADGNNQRAITRFSPAEGRPQLPAWSPDGQRIAFQASATDPADTSRHVAHIWTVDLTTGALTKLAPHTTAYLDEVPSWSADGKWIAFQSNRTGRFEAWVMDTRGGSLRQITR